MSDSRFGGSDREASSRRYPVEQSAQRALDAVSFIRELIEQAPPWREKAAPQIPSFKPHNTNVPVAMGFEPASLSSLEYRTGHLFPYYLARAELPDPP